MARILITSALPYINGVKHLGNLVGSMLPADIYARFSRMRGHETLFICATDEHGTPAELAARAAGQSVAAYCDEQHQIQARACEGFALSFDHFGRSSSPSNHALTQHFAAALEANGLIEARTDKQIYSLADERFLPDRYVEGVCPHCGFDKARGDQCDNCGNLLEPSELIEPYSTISKSHDVELRETTHLYLLQSQMQERIGAWVESHQNWPQLTKSIAMKWLNEGLRDRSITRDLSWGVPVARDGEARPGFEDKVFYVWFDAPIAYIAATQDWAAASGEDWRRWWRTDQGAEDVTYVQFMGKDNVAFHTVSFPVTLLGSQEPWKTVDDLKALNWLTWYGGKFSTSESRGVFMDEALAMAPADAWRWQLMANAPESDDASFTLEQFAAQVNKDLADVLGNFVNRITRFGASKFGETVPDAGAYGELEKAYGDRVTEGAAALARHFEAMEFRKACVALRGLWVAGNEFLQEAEPWKTIKADEARAAASVRFAYNLILLFGELSHPFIPDAAAKMRAIFGQDGAAPRWPDDVDEALGRLRGGEGMRPAAVLFSKIEDDDVARWRERFNAGKD